MEVFRFFKGRDSGTAVEEFIVFDPGARIDGPFFVKSIGQGLKLT